MAALGAGVEGEPDWRVAVHAAEDPGLADLLSSRLPASGAPRSISVTDLLAPRRAYWRGRGPPIPFPPDREVRLDAGRRLHRALGLVFGDQGALEVRVRRDGVHGRVDVLTDRPIEVKTTGAPLPSGELLRSRPDHVDQLGSYCALLDRSDGRLLYFRLDDQGVAETAAWDLTFEDLPGLRGALAERADDLREAQRAGDPDALPRCPWYGRGCEFRSADVCDCTGEEVEAAPLTGHLPAEPTARPDVADSVRAALPAMGPRPPSLVSRFRDLLYPRQAFFRHRVEPTAPTPPPVTGGGESDLYRRLTEAVESGPTGEVARLPTRSEEPEEEVGGLRGVPYLIRTSRARGRLAAADWLVRSPQYALELGFRCVATGVSNAVLVVGYENPPAGGRAVQIVRFSFDPVSVFSRVWRARAGALDDAAHRDDPSALPACPGWMAERCDYRDGCGCGTPSGRVQWKRTVDAVRTKPSD